MNKKDIKIFILFIILFISMPFKVSAQAGITRPSTLSPELDSLFSIGKFDSVEFQALRRLYGSEDFDENELIGAYLYLGFTHVLADKNVEAERDFFNALTMSPGLQLDPVYVPPVVYQAFRNARESFQRSLYDEDSSEDSINKDRLKVRTRAAIANLAIPGAGFYVESKPLRGTTWSILQIGSTVAFIYSMNRSDHYHDIYLKTATTGDFDKNYDKYNDWHKRSWGWGIAAAAIYITSQIDFHLSWNNVTLEANVDSFEPTTHDSEPALSPVKLGLKFTF